MSVQIAPASCSLLLAIVAGLAVSTTGRAQEFKPLRAEDVDRTPTSQISRDEFLIALRYNASPYVRKTDVAPRDGIPDVLASLPAEQRDKILQSVFGSERLGEDLVADVIDVTLSRFDEEATNGWVTVAAANRLLKLPKDPPPIQPADGAMDGTGKSGDDDAKKVGTAQSSIAIRADGSQLLIETLKEAKPASFSITHDLDASDTVYAVKGVIGLINSPAGGVRFIPYLDVDRTVGTGSSVKETNLLALRALYAKNFIVRAGEEGGDQVGLRWGIDPFYVTDFDLHAHQVGADLTLDLLSRDAGFWSASDELRYGPVKVLWQPRLLLQYKHVLNDGDNPALANEDVVRLGAGLGISITPKPSGWDRLSLTVNLENTNVATDHWQGDTLVEATLGYDLDKEKTGQVALIYRHGVVELTEQEVDVISIGFTYKR